MFKHTEQLRKHNCLHCGRRVKTANDTAGAGWILNLGRCNCEKPELSIYAEVEGIDRAHGAASATALEDVDIPEVIAGRFEVIDLLGKGGMGVVYKVRDVELDRLFAIKTLRQNVAKDTSVLKRFELEAEAISGLNHPNIVTVYQHGITETGEPYLVTEYAPGETLADLIENEGPPSEDRAIKILIQIAEALAYAHERGVIHRDVKPSNILILKTEAGEDLVKVLDFGIAKTLPGVDRETRTLTQTGEVFGSPHYMSPEQCLGFMLDQRSDVYSFGCLLYELLSGKPPFAGTNPIQLLVKHINDQPKQISRKFVRTEKLKSLQAISMVCMEKEQIDRFQNMSELVSELERIAAGKRFSSFAHSRFRRSLTIESLSVFSVIFAAMCALTVVCTISKPDSQPIELPPFLGSLLVSITVIFPFVSLIFIANSCAKLARDQLASPRVWWLANSFYAFAMAFGCGMTALFSRYELVKLLQRDPAPPWIFHFLDLFIVLVSVLAFIGLIAGSIGPILMFLDMGHKKIRWYVVSAKLAACSALLIVVCFIVVPKQFAFFLGNFATDLARIPSSLTSGADRILIQSALQLQPNETYLLNEMGSIYLRHGQYRRAISTYTKIIEATPKDNPNLPTFLSFRASLYAVLGEFDEALADQNRVIELKQSASELLMRGIYNFQSCNYSLATEDIDKTIEMDPSLLPPYLIKSYLLVSKGELDKALSTIAIQEKLQNANELQTSYWRGLIFSRAGKPKDAAIQFNKAIAVKTSTLREPGAMLINGLALIELERPDEARLAFDSSKSDFLLEEEPELWTRSGWLRLSIYPPDIRKKAARYLGITSK